MLKDRVTRDGRIIHWGPNGTLSYGRDDQCEYNGCKSSRAAHSRHCMRHTR